MSLNVKDASAQTVVLKTTVAGGEHTTHHIIDNTGFNSLITDSIFSAPKDASITGVEVLFLGGESPTDTVVPMQLTAGGQLIVGEITPKSAVVVDSIGVTDTATAQQLGSNVISRGVYIHALSTNAGITFLGNSSGVSATAGYGLEPGDTIFLDITNTNLLWLFGTEDDVITVIGS